MMAAFPQVYLVEVVETQGRLFDLVAQEYPNKDTEDFIRAYMSSKTRKAIDESQAYVMTLNVKDLLDFFIKYDNYTLKSGKALTGFMPAWIGEFYAYYQWYYDISSAELIQKLPLVSMRQIYHGLHDLELPLAVQKVGNIL